MYYLAHDSFKPRKPKIKIQETHEEKDKKGLRMIYNSEIPPENIPLSGPLLVQRPYDMPRHCVNLIDAFVRAGKNQDHLPPNQNYYRQKQLYTPVLPEYSDKEKEFYESIKLKQSQLSQDRYIADKIEDFPPRRNDQKNCFCPVIVRGDSRSIRRHPRGTKYVLVTVSNRTAERNTQLTNEGYFDMHLGGRIGPRTFLAEIGCGSTATVWLTYNNVENTYAALKIHKVKESVAREVETLQAIQTSGILPFVQCIKNAPEIIMTPYPTINMEFVGPSLTEVVEKIGGVNWEIAKRISYQILIGLQYLHDGCRIIHCDLDMDSVLIKLFDEDVAKLRKVAENAMNGIEDDDQFYMYNFADPSCHMGIKISDFGKSRKRREECKELVQKCSYRAPEVFLGGSYGPAIDIWSLGCISFELMTGEQFSPCKDDDTTTCSDEDHLNSFTTYLGRMDGSVFEDTQKKDDYFKGSGYMGTQKDGRLAHLIKHLCPLMPEDKLAVFNKFLRGCLTFDPELRYTADLALNDKFVEKGWL